MQIDVPAGTKAAASPDTAELVLDAGQELSVDQVTANPDGSTVMTLTVLGDTGGTPDAPGADPAAPDAPASFDERVQNSRTGNDALGAAPSSIAGDSNLPPEQRDSLEQYRGDENYRTINAALRGATDEELGAMPLAGGDTSRETVDNHVRNMDAAMDNSRLTDDVTVYRGIGNASRMFGDRLNGDLTGTEWREDAYVSTTADGDVSEDFAGNLPPGSTMMRVVVPRGTGAIQLSDSSYESELLLQRGLTMRVVADHGTVDGVRRIDVEVVPANAT